MNRDHQTAAHRLRGIALRLEREDRGMLARELSDIAQADPHAAELVRPIVAELTREVAMRLRARADIIDGHDEDNGA